MNADEMAVKLAEVDQRSKSNTHRINELSGQIDAVNKLAVSVERLVIENQHQTEELKEVKSDLSGLTGKVEQIEQKPAKKWDGLVEKVIWALVAAAITYILVRLGLA